MQAFLTVFEGKGSHCSAISVEKPPCQPKKQKAVFTVSVPTERARGIDILGNLRKKAHSEALGRGIPCLMSPEGKLIFSGPFTGSANEKGE